ncbi:Amino acid transporter-like protein [Zostera marina]|uniref:Amino acid transporter-like protein n=1 Tax=Zostera marina TaxID=29655 RepID=A0A0K9Q5X1_ZOSMR|nr:Amino acid transporter-like protein [Zostera marina]
MGEGFENLVELRIINGSAKSTVSSNSTGDSSDRDERPLIGGDGDFGDSDSGSSVSGAVFNLSTSIIGAGIMALPATMKVLGLLVGLFAIFAMGIISEYSIELLIRFSVLCGSLSYGDVVESAIGYSGRVVSEICIIINNAGVLIVYLIIIGDVMSGNDKHVGVFYQWFGHTVLDHRTLVIFIVLILFLAPLCSLEKIDSLVMTSAASVALAIVFVIVSCLIASIKIINGTVKAPRMGPDFSSKSSILDLLVVIPIMTNAYVCHFNVQPIYNDLKGRSAAKMNKVGRITTILCVIVFAFTAVSGYLLFGDDTEPDILTNFDKNLGIKFSNGLNYIVRVGYVLHLILVFPVIHFSMRQAVGALVFRETLLVGKKRVWGLTAILLLLIYLGSTLIPNIWVAFKFTGATTALSVGFIFPSLIALRLGNPSDSSDFKLGETIVSWIMLVFAVLVSIVGVVGNVYSLRKSSA